MSTDVDLWIGDYDQLLFKLCENPKVKRDKLTKILKECGMYLEGKYLIVNNEHADEYNPFNVLIKLIDLAFGEDAHKPIYQLLNVKECYLDISDIATKLRIPLEDDDEYEDEDESEPILDTLISAAETIVEAHEESVSQMDDEYVEDNEEEPDDNEDE